MRHPRRIAPALGLLFFVLVVLAIRPAALRAHTVSVAPPDQLGKVNFPTSCVADVQPTIEKGVALLHSFQYKESEQMFTEAAKRDPKCAMAYWGKAMIHATDRPELAAEGLEAARHYAAIAPDSAHALHMPSHIFVRLGLWQDSINSNIAANTSGAHAAEMHLAESHYQTHAMDFLSYSYLQSGQEAKAREVIEHTDHVVGASEESKAEHRAYFTARTALELHRWKEAAALPVPATRKEWLDTVYWARAIGAARSGDVTGAETDVKELTQLVAGREKRARKEGYGVSNEKATDLREAEAWLAFAKGNPDEALQELRAAADHQDKNGGESVSVPAREMLADMLLELKRPAEALAEYKIVLKNSPNRFDGLLGAARSAQATSDAGDAQSFYAKLAEICGPGADRPELTEAKTYLAQK